MENARDGEINDLGLRVTFKGAKQRGALAHVFLFCDVGRRRRDRGQRNKPERPFQRLSSCKGPIASPIWARHCLVQYASESPRLWLPFEWPGYARFSATIYWKLAAKPFGHSVFPVTEALWRCDPRAAVLRENGGARGGWAAPLGGGELFFRSHSLHSKRFRATWPRTQTCSYLAAPRYENHQTVQPFLEEEGLGQWHHRFQIMRDLRSKQNGFAHTPVSKN